MPERKQIHEMFKIRKMLWSCSYAVRFQQTRLNKFRYPSTQCVFYLTLPMGVNNSTDKMPDYTDFILLQNLCSYLDISTLDYPIETSFCNRKYYLRTVVPHISILSLLTSFRWSHSLCSPSVHDCWYTVSFSTDKEGKRTRSHVLPLTFVHAHQTHSVNTEHCEAQYRYAPHNDVSFNDGPHIWRWSQNIIITTIVLQLPTVFNMVTCCTGL
jgi:hypothetical protein